MAVETPREPHPSSRYDHVPGFGPSRRMAHLLARFAPLTYRTVSLDKISVVDYTTSVYICKYLFYRRALCQSLLLSREPC
mgnify:CR=1 FL=1